MKIKKYLEQSPVFAINATYEALIPHLNKQLRSEGLNLLQGLVLTALFFEESKTVTPSRLAELFQTSRGNMSHILSHLESKGWVRRIVHDKDARQFHMELRADGRKKALSLIRFYDRLQGLFERELGVLACHKIVDGLNSISNTYRNSKM
jgi:DNA-binding MarR family transcriptional regulator